MTSRSYISRRASRVLSSPPTSLHRLYSVSPSCHAARKPTMSEDAIKRNPHPDFKKVEASRPPFDSSASLQFTQAPAPEWKFGDGSNGTDAGAVGKKHVAIDPYEDGRPAVFNYKLLISSVVPRPIAFLSTRSADGKTTNLAPFSYFNFFNHDPPLFVVGIVPDGTKEGGAKDSLKNITETGEAVINIISEHYVEAANATSINAPYGASEWDVSGLTPAYDTETVKVARVKEAIFSVEVKLDTIKEYESKTTPGKKTSSVVILEGTRFWVREDALNEDKNLVDPAVSATNSISPGTSNANHLTDPAAYQPSWWHHLLPSHRGVRASPSRLPEGPRRPGESRQAQER